MYIVFADVPVAELGEKLEAYHIEPKNDGDAGRSIFSIKCMCPGKPTPDGASTLTVLFLEHCWTKCSL